MQNEKATQNKKKLEEKEKERVTKSQEKMKYNEVDDNDRG